MSRKKKKKQLGPADQLAIAERELEKGNAKQAIKYAKACYRKDPSEPVRALLQRALLSRGRELHSRLKFDPARAVIVELDSLGEFAAEYHADVARLRALLGIEDDGAAEDLIETDRKLRDELADHAVLHGPESSSRGEFLESAEAIRSALIAVEENQTQSAYELIAPISRDSSFADWKLLIRGLVAYYEADEPRMVANWSRLSQDRPAHRIAETLSVVAGTQRSADVSGTIRARVDRLVSAVETPLLGGLRALQRKMRDPDTDGPTLRAALRNWMTAHAKAEPAIAIRLGQLVVNRMIKQEDAYGLVALKRVLSALPLDPNLNRAAALLHECDGDLNEVERFWNAYIKDLKTCESLSESRRATAVAMVYLRMAVQLCEAARYAEEDHEYCEQLRWEAESYLRKGQEADPTLPGTYLCLGRLLRTLGREKEAAATYKELGRRFPDDFEAMAAIATHFIEENQPGVAKTYARKASELRPRDDVALSLVWRCCISTAREAAKLNQIGLAEAELDEAEAILSSHDRLVYVLYSIRAAVAFKHNQCERGEEFLAKTVEQFELPTAALLIVHSQVLRCGGTNPETRRDLKSRLDKCLKGKKNSQAAGVMAHYMQDLEQTAVQYSGMATHLKQVTTYLSKCGRVKWRPDDLIHACRFASSAQDRQSLLTKLAQRGRKLFCKNPYFHIFAGQAELMRGAHHCNCPEATRHFERAIELSRTGDISLDEADLQAISQALSVLQRSRLMPSFGSSLFDIADDDDDGDGDESEGVVRLDSATFERLMATMPPDLKRELEELGHDPMTVLVQLAEELGMNSN